MDGPRVALDRALPLLYPIKCAHSGPTIRIISKHTTLKQR